MAWRLGRRDPRHTSAWLWPGQSSPKSKDQRHEFGRSPATAARGQYRPSSTGWWAMLGGIVTEAALFGYLLFSYYYVAVQPHTGLVASRASEFALALPNTFILLASSIAIWFGGRGA